MRLFYAQEQSYAESAQERKKPMVTVKSLYGKPYAGNPHVQFDEEEVASAVTPRRGGLFYNDKIRKAMLLLWGTVLFALQGTAAVTASGFELSGPDNGSVTLSWTVSGSAGGMFYLNGTYNVAVTRGTSSNQSAQTRTIVGGENSGAYMQQTGNSGHVTDTPPATGQTYYYWLHYAPYSIIDDTQNFFFCYLGGSYGTIRSSSCIGPISVFVPAPGQNKIKVTFDPNGGQGEMVEQDFEVDVPQKLSKNTFRKDGYVFQGWAETADGPVKYTDEQEITIDSDMTLYAVWEEEPAPPQTYTIIFNANGGTGTMQAQSFESGKEQNLSKNTFSKDGYVFQGWAETADGPVKYTDEQEITADHDMTLYAVWANPPLTLAAESADWSSGSITLRCEDADKSGIEHTYTLEYCNENGTWVAADDAQVSVTKGQNANNEEVWIVRLTDPDFSSRLGGIPPVSYRVKDENRRLSEPCVTRTRYGLFVGIDRYAGYISGSLSNLKECVTDAKGWEQAFSANGGCKNTKLISVCPSKA